MNDNPLVFDDLFLRKLERIELVARKIFRGQMHGEHTTRRRGRGLEFSDFRRYRPGDDFRYVDWNIYSRLDQLFLKLLHLCTAVVFVAAGEQGQAAECQRRKLSCYHYMFIKTCFQPDGADAATKLN